MLEKSTILTNTLIIGAGAAGLAVGAGLRRLRIPLAILEKNDTVGSAWLGRYDRLHLHTHRRFSALPFLSFPRHFPVYPSRLQFAEYLQHYAQSFDLNPVFNAEVIAAGKDYELWKTKTADRTYVSRNLVVATGYCHTPVLPEWPGMDGFSGRILHSSEYTRGASFKDKKVLVVGFGNSAGEIALDLFESGASVAMSVRGPVNVVPRDVLGVSTHALSVMMNWLPTEVADVLSAGLRRVVVGDLTPYGLQRPAMGPMTQIKRTDQVPLLDIGTIPLIKAGKVRVVKEIERFERDTVVFTDGASERFDAVILGTGFKSNVGSFLKPVGQVVDENGKVLTSGRETNLGGLFFCGFYNAPAGFIREIGREARQIVRAIGKKPATIPQHVAETV